MVHDWMNLSWKLLMVRGGLGIVFGVVAIVWPIETVLALVILWGVWALVDGVGSIAQAFTRESTGGAKVWLSVMGVIAVLAALFAFTRPGLAAATLTWLLGIWLIVRAVFEAVAAFSTTRDTPRWLLLLGAAASLVIGILFVANPGTGAVAIAVWLGIVALVWGVAFVALGFAVWRASAEPTPPAGAHLRHG